jgi:carboxymethylenebutenolidase
MPVPGEVRDPAALDAADISVDAAGGPLRAYLARPRGADGGARAGVIVVHEAMGLNDHIRDVARRFAAAGYHAIAPELYTRIGPPQAADWETIRAKLFALSDAQVVSDLSACAAHLRSLPGASGRVGCIGFCAGGRTTLLFAASGGAIDAAVDCWGGFVDRASPDEETTPNRPRRVIDMLDGVRCPLLLVGGAEDGNPSPDVLREVHSRLVALGRTAELHIYDGAGHAFFADYRPSYRETQAFALWGEVQEFFAQHLR